MRFIFHFVSYKMMIVQIRIVQILIFKLPKNKGGGVQYGLDKIQQNTYIILALDIWLKFNL